MVSQFSQVVTKRHTKNKNSFYDTHPSHYYHC